MRPSGKAVDTKIKLSFDINQEKEKEYNDGDIVEIQILRQGIRKHDRYGTVKIDQKFMDNVKKHFDANTLGQEIPVDENHEPEKKAVSWFRGLLQKGKNMFAKIELTKKGAEFFNNKTYKYFSPEFSNWKNGETGQMFKKILTGGAFTNNPYFKGMQKMVASDDSMAAEGVKPGSNQDKNTSFYFSYSMEMNKVKELLEQYSEKAVLTNMERTKLVLAFNDLSEEEQKEVEKDVEEKVNAEPEAAKKEEDGDEGGEGEGKKGGEDGENGDEGKQTHSDDQISKEQFAAERERNDKLEKRLAFMELEKKTQESTQKFNNIVEQGKGLLQKQKDAYVEFRNDLTDEQAVVFDSFFEQMENTAQYFKQDGVGHSETQNDREAHAKKVKAYMDKNQCTYSEAADAISRQNFAG